MKKYMIIISIVVCFGFLLTACGGKSNKVTNSNNKNETDEIDMLVENEEKDSAMEEDKEEEDMIETVDANSKLNTIADFSDLWTSTYQSNEAAINSSEFVILEIVFPGMCFVSGVQYDLLNLNNKDGRFEGTLILAGFDGFVERKGSKLTFGYEDVLDKDGFSPSMKAGDKKVENGNCDLSKGYYYTEQYTERNGEKIERIIEVMKKESDGSITCFYQSGHNYNYREEEEKSNSLVFVRNGKGQYDFVVAEAKLGSDFSEFTLEDNMTKERAIELFEAAGFNITHSGGIENGVLVINK